jgi:hypothetical protein
MVFVMQADYHEMGGVFALLSQIMYGQNPAIPSSQEDFQEIHVCSSFLRAFLLFFSQFAESFLLF